MYLPFFRHNSCCIWKFQSKFHEFTNSYIMKRSRSTKKRIRIVRTTSTNARIFNFKTLVMNSKEYSRQRLCKNPRINAVRVIFFLSCIHFRWFHFTSNFPKSYDVSLTQALSTNFPESYDVSLTQALSTNFPESYDVSLTQALSTNRKLWTDSRNWKMINIRRVSIAIGNQIIN
jgi:hypothetical protein